MGAAQILCGKAMFWWCGPGMSRLNPKHLIETIAVLEERNIAFKSLSESHASVILVSHGVVVGRRS